MLSLSKKEATVSHYSFSYFKGGIILEKLLVQEKWLVNNWLVRNVWDAMSRLALRSLRANIKVLKHFFSLINFMCAFEIFGELWFIFVCTVKTHNFGDDLISAVLHNIFGNNLISAIFGSNQLNHISAKIFSPNPHIGL